MSIEKRLQAIERARFEKCKAILDYKVSCMTRDEKHAIFGKKDLATFRAWVYETLGEHGLTKVWDGVLHSNIASWD